jgi:hypothetical protein
MDKIHVEIKLDKKTLRKYYFIILSKSSIGPMSFLLTIISAVIVWYEYEVPSPEIFYWIMAYFQTLLILLFLTFYMPFILAFKKFKTQGDRAYSFTREGFNFHLPNADKIEFKWDVVLSVTEQNEMLIIATKIKENRILFLPKNAFDSERYGSFKDILMTEK